MYQEDYNLSKQIAKGDESAIKEVIFRYGKPLYAFIYRQVQNPSDSEELLQETWYKMVKGINYYNPNYKFSTFLFQIAINLCRDYHRNKKIELKAININNYCILKEINNIEENLIFQEKEKKLHKALNTLSNEQKEVLLLRYFHGMGEEEIATIVKSSKGTVKSRIFYGIKKLKDILNKKED